MRLYPIIAVLIFLLAVPNWPLTAQVYTFDVKDTTTYSITCGRTTGSYWGVKNDSCTLTTSTITGLGAACVDTSLPIQIPFDLKINQTGNLACNDTAWVEYMLDSVWIVHDTIVGCEQTSNSTYNYLATGYSGCTFTMRVTFSNHSPNDWWQIQDGDIEVHDPCLFLPLQSFTINGESNLLGNELVVKVESPFEIGEVIIEKRIGGVFEPIGYAEFQADNRGVSTYGFLDQDFEPVSYYRARVYDAGKATYTSVIKIASSKLEQLVVSPNPSSSQFKLGLPNWIEDRFEIHLLDRTGAVVKNWEQVVEQSQNQYPLEVSDIPAGMYMLVMESGSYRTSTLVTVNR